MSDTTSFQNKWKEDGSGWWADIYDAYPGYKPSHFRDHDHFLTEALWSYWSKNDAIGYQRLADAYNKFVRKDDERPLLPPPAYL